ncbi:hypothetical protein JHL18_11745 [Clostridium sp. YIM B02505]|uniref:Butirosin biosynthesis protein H N-terminal domain-containing protein n=1 Tax=Clostridium yunnanense TaxID=2800325 RepID=A0ABS1EPI7_9CLOT|nr:hypothetical protein [Clostridium yunnanense]MBK1811299.1 hypothetical protein [Clostridium yunnanense]
MCSNLVTVEPYNQVLYNNCLYNTLLSACQYFGFSDEFILTNDFFSYKLNKKENRFFVDRDVIKIQEDIPLLRDMGIECHIPSDQSNPVKYIRDSLSNGRLVMICIDQYVFEKSPFYASVHSMYHMLLYAHHDNVFNALSLMDGQCIQTTISEQEVYIGMQDKKRYFSNHIPDFDLMSLYCDDHKIRKNDYMVKFKKNFRECSTELINRAEILSEAAKYYSAFDFNSLKDVSLEDYPHSLTHMIVAKKVQIYQNQMMFGNNDLIMENLTQALNNMRILLAAFTKVQLFFRINRDVNQAADIIITRLNNLCKIEKEYIHLLDKVCSGIN